MDEQTIIAAAQERGARRPGYSNYGNGWHEIAIDVEVDGQRYEVRKRVDGHGSRWGAGESWRVVAPA